MVDLGDPMATEPTASQPENAVQPVAAGESVGQKAKRLKAQLDASSKIATGHARHQVNKVKGQALATDSGDKAAGWTRSATSTAGEKLGEFGQTGVGQKVSGATKAFGGVMSKIPGLSVMGDSVAIRNGVDVLTERVKSDPKNADTLLHLALALRRTAKQMKQVRIAKAIVKPQSLVMSTAMRTAASMGSDAMPTEEKLLRAAHKRSMAIKKSRPTDADNLHLLARIFLAQRHSAPARKLARLALAASPSHPGDVYVTLAYVESLAGNRAGAYEYARLAAKNGSTLGHSVAADLALGTKQPMAERMRSYEHHIARVDVADEERYFGVPLNAKTLDTGKRLLNKHKKKPTDLADSATKQAVALKARAEAELREQQTKRAAALPAGQAYALGPAPSGWHPDPYGRFDYRFWDGANWTEGVATGGVASRDRPPPGHREAPSTSPQEIH